MLAQINDGCAICRLVAQCADPQIALRELQIALRDRQIAQIHRLRLTYVNVYIMSFNSNCRILAAELNYRFTKYCVNF